MHRLLLTHARYLLLHALKVRLMDDSVKRKVHKSVYAKFELPPNKKNASERERKRNGAIAVAASAMMVAKLMVVLPPIHPFKIIRKSFLHVNESSYNKRSKRVWISENNNAFFMFDSVQKKSTWAISSTSTEKIKTNSSNPNRQHENLLYKSIVIVFSCL